MRSLHLHRIKIFYVQVFEYFDVITCRVELFPDNPVPPLQRALEMFNSAFLVIAPHGAGLSNMFFSEPGTVIIEGLCYDASRANLCYR